MKKLFAVTLVLAILFCLSGCGATSAYSLVSGAVKKTASLDSYAAKMTMGFEMELEDKTVTIPPIVYDVAASGMRGKNPVMRIKTTSSSEAGENNMDMYVENGNYYISVMGEKYQVPAEKITDDMRMDNTLDKIITDMPKELFDGIEVTKEKSGLKVITINPDEQTFSELYSELLEQTEDSLGAANASVSLTDTEIKIAVDKNGYIASETVSFTMKIVTTAAGKELEVSADAEIKVEYTDPGSDVTVEAIPGYKDFMVIG